MMNHSVIFILFTLGCFGQIRCQEETSTVVSQSGCENGPSEFDGTKFVERGKKIVGVGLNYRWTKVDLARVFVPPKEPIIFLKPTTSYLMEPNLIKLPKSLGTIYYELELGVVIGRKGKDIQEEEALDYVSGYFLALDMTAKQFLNKKIEGRPQPWEIGKGFDTACPVGPFVSRDHIPDPNNVTLSCWLNGNLTQHENTSQMIFDVPKLIAHISRYFTLEPYDVILTGTPDGFGAMTGGDEIQASLGNNLSFIHFKAVDTL